MPKYQKMDPKFKARWLKALRSGKYEQGQEALRTRSVLDKKPKYCCLGVAADIMKDVTWSEYDQVIFKGKHTFMSGSIPDEVAQTVGLNDEAQIRLACFNDGKTKNGKRAHRKNFNEIADWIEKNL